eukprot:1160536-Pelagomonas_calceolata.AAC.3
MHILRKTCAHSPQDQVGYLFKWTALAGQAACEATCSAGAHRPRSRGQMNNFALWMHHFAGATCSQPANFLIGQLILIGQLHTFAYVYDERNVFDHIRYLRASDSTQLKWQNVFDHVRHLHASDPAQLKSQNAFHHVRHLHASDPAQLKWLFFHQAGNAGLTWHEQHCGCTPVWHHGCLGTSVWHCGCLRMSVWARAPRDIWDLGVYTPELTRRH